MDICTKVFKKQYYVVHNHGGIYAVCNFRLNRDLVEIIISLASNGICCLCKWVYVDADISFLYISLYTKNLEMHLNHSRQSEPARTAEIVVVLSMSNHCIHSHFSFTAAPYNCV